MAVIKAYHRPTSPESALMLLGRHGVNTALVAGGTSINARLKDEPAFDAVDEVVDLQAAGLDGIRLAGDRLTLGAMVRIQDLVDCTDAPDLVRSAAKREGPNTFRRMGTVGGAIASGGWESEFLAVLLVHATDVEVLTAEGQRSFSLEELLADVPRALAGGLITSITLSTSGTAAADWVARTPADAPIVAAVGRRDLSGRIQLAFSGVASRPVLVEAGEVAGLNPPGDFRGSSAYRREMAEVLSRRVLAAIA